jgi:dihydroorotase
MYDVLLKNGEIIDPSQGIHTVGSAAIKDGKIALVGKNFSRVEAKKVLNMEGKIIAPGLIDLHCHPVAGFAWIGVPSDEIGLNTGVALLCDGGSSGAANFETMRRFILEPTKTDIFCFLNLSTTGLIKMPEILANHDIDVDYSKRVVEANRNIIKGIKIRAIQPLAEGLGLKGIEMAKKLATDLRMPLMVHLGETRERAPGDKMDDFSRATVAMLDEGDILSHYLTWEPGGMILKDGTIYPELEEAQKRGVVLDSCHGLNHFSFTIARHAIAKGFIPTVISTDMSTIGLPVVQSLAVVMSKFLNMGLSVAQVIEMTTVNSAKALGEEDKRGSLRPGMSADITVLELLQGDYLFGDGTGRESMHGKLLLEPRMVFKGGEPMPAYSRYHIPPLFK